MQPRSHHETQHPEPLPDFRERLDEITSRQLDARSIHSYADEALEDLIALVQSAIEQQGGNTEAAISGIERERDALSSVGLDPSVIEHTLDHIVAVADSTRRLDSLVMRNTRLMDTVIIPPSPDNAVSITQSDGSFEKPKEMIPKLHTLLLLLEKGLDINIDNNDQVQISTGLLQKNMMRGASYSLVEIPDLQRVVLTCDEVGNATYVFDQMACSEYGIDAQYLASQTKPELYDLIKRDARLGRRIVYSSEYVSNLGAALQGESVEQLDPDTGGKAAIDILKPKAPLAPEDHLSASGIAKKLGVSYEVVVKAVDELTDELGEVQDYRFGSNTAPGYSPDQIEQIAQHLDIAPTAPEGYLSVRGIAKKLDVSNQTVNKAIKELGDELGEVKNYRFGPKMVPGYSPDQIEQIAQYLDVAPTAPEGYLSVRGIAKKLDVSHWKVDKVIKELGDELGEVQDYRFGNNTASGYSPDQIEQIARWIRDNIKSKIAKTAITSASIVS